MKTYGHLLVLCGLAALVGCSSGGGRTRMDGGISFVDSGTPPRDSGTSPTDSGGPPPTDSGIPPTGCTLTDNGLTGASCFPRCSAATLDAVNACMTASCQSMATMADTTAGITIDVGGMPLMVDCRVCFNIQINSCLFNACPDQFSALVDCETATPGMCMAQDTALNDCLEPQMMTVQSCINMRASLCFPGA